MEMETLAERWRPARWADLVAQDKARDEVAGIRARHGSVAGRAWWVTGASGTGKTTVARLLAGEVAEPICIEELDATRLTPTTLDTIERAMRLYGWPPRGGRAYVVNEAHGLRRDTVRQMLVLLERIPHHVVWVFTTTTDGEAGLFEDNEDTGPLVSRCTLLRLSRQGLAKPFAEYAKRVAMAEGMDGKPVEAYVRLLQEKKNNLRAALMAVEAGAME